MAEWISNHCREEFQKAISPDAATYLADALGPEPAVAHAELAKLVCSAPDAKTITVEFAASMVAPQREMDAYELQKPFGDRDQKAFVQTLRKLTRQGIDTVPIVSTLYQHAVRLLHTQAMLAENATPNEIAVACGMNPWIFTKIHNMPAQAAKWPQALLPRVIQRLGEMDFELKIGRYASTPEFELAICALIVR